MIFWDIFKMSAGALRANKLRSFLTLLGVIIGVTSVITIISALEGLSQSIQAELATLGPTTFIVDRFGMIMGHDEFMEALKRKPMKSEYGDMILDGCEECEKVGLQDGFRGEAKYKNNKVRRARIIGASASMIDIVDTEVDQGRFYMDEEEKSRMRVAFIGDGIAEELYSGLDPIGRDIKLEGIKYKVVGIAKKKGASLDEDADKNIFIPYSTYVKDFAGRYLDPAIFVKAKSLEKLPVAMDQARVVLRSARHVPYDKNDDFGMTTADAVMEAINNITKFIRFGLIGVSAIALVVGGIIIMNIMMVSVTERTREIGIRKSVGARQRDILMQFLYESLILSLGGGMVGIGIGLFLGKTLINLINMDMTPTLFAISLGLIISSGTGLFFGIYPAMKAARLQPVKALGFE